VADSYLNCLGVQGDCLMECQNLEIDLHRWYLWVCGLVIIPSHDMLNSKSNFKNLKEIYIFTI